MSEGADVLVVGAGVVGLAIARRLALDGAVVAVAEAADAPGTGISSRSSEVVHAGLYYPTGSLKARLCVAGRRALYPYCEARGVPYRRCGKLVVAVGATEVPALEALHEQARTNGVADVRWLDAHAARGLEPGVRCEAALWSPSTGIVDSHGLVRALASDLRTLGGALALRSPVGGARRRGRRWVAQVAGAPFECSTLIGSAGLGAWDLARTIDGMPAGAIPPRHLAKGTYFGLSGPAPFGHLVYPLPIVGGLGIHATLDLGGRVRFGPDVQWVEAEDYAPDPARAAAFYDAVRRYWPALPDGALVPDYAGIRPKLHGPGDARPDFRIDGPEVHGMEGLVCLFGIESPGLTAALAIAEEVAVRAARMPA